LRLYIIPGASAHDNGLPGILNHDFFIYSIKLDASHVEVALLLTCFIICNFKGTGQIGTVIVVASVVTVDPNDNALPIHLVFSPTVIPASSMIVHKNVVLAANVVAALGVQKISHEDAPLLVEITVFAAVFNAPSDLKIKLPFQLNKSGHEIFIAPILQYTQDV
jgi:hypothetical protein